MTHFVADNVDHNLRTLTGSKTFHGMGIIFTSLNPYGFGKFNSKLKIQRLTKPLKAFEATYNKSVPIMPFNLSDKPGLGIVELAKFDDLFLLIKF